MAVRRAYAETPRAGIKPALRNPRTQVGVPVALVGWFEIEEGLLTSRAAFGMTGVFIARLRVENPRGPALRARWGQRHGTKVPPLHSRPESFLFVAEGGGGV